MKKPIKYLLFFFAATTPCFSTAQNPMQCCIGDCECGPCFTPVPYTDSLGFTRVKCVFIDNCQCNPQCGCPGIRCSGGPRVEGSIDPNDLIPPESANGWVRRDNRVLSFRVLFENLPEATLPAQRVEIEIPLMAHVDYGSFELNDFGFGDFYHVTTPGLQLYDQVLPLSAQFGVDVRVQVSINTVTGVAQWIFQSLDPNTGQPPVDINAGFLPPNIPEIGNGEGFANFSIRPDPASQTFDQIDFMASIVFDENEAIMTPMALLTIDADAPVSTVSSFVTSPDAQHMRLSWSGTDIGSGLKNYTLFVSENGGHYKPWLVETDSTSGLLRAVEGNTYRILCIARDSVHNVEQKTVFDQEITFLRWFPDADADGFGWAGAEATVYGTAPMGYVANNLDCDDDNPAVNPVANEICNGFDDNCDGLTDEEDPQVNCNQPPVALCQDITVSVDVTCETSITVQDIDGGSSDPDGDLFNSSLSTTGPFGVGSYIVALTVSDAEFSDACTATVTVQDNTAPVFICDNLSVALNENGTAAILPAEIFNPELSSDNCGIDENSLSLDIASFDCTDLGVNVVVLNGWDVNGNPGSCNATITVLDITPPAAACQNVTVVLDAAGNASISTAAIDNGTTDACGVASLSINANNFSCSHFGDNIVTLTATDVNGNSNTCSAIVTVEDHIPPVAQCQPAVVQLDASGNGILNPAQVDNGSSDVCGISLSVDQPNFNCSDIGNTHAVTLTATDPAGNTNTCTASVTVEDNVAPNSLCQPFTLYLDAGGNGNITVANVDAGSSDACGLASLVLDKQNFNCADIGNNTVVLSATDVHNNTASCTATVTVLDPVPPVAVCQDLTVELDAAGVGGITAAQVNNNSSDACGIDTYTLSETAFDCSSVGVNTITLTATDVNGNSATCTAAITVQDNIAPSLQCAGFTLNLDNDGNGTLLPASVADQVSDACGIQSQQISPNTFDCSNAGSIYPVILTVTDNHGNASSCTADVLVQDAVAPTAVCEGITVELNNAGFVSITATQIGGNSTDACGVASLSLNNTDFSCADVGTSNAVTLTATDINGNTATCTAIISVEDNIAPVAVCQDKTVELGPDGQVIISAAEVNNGSSDACGIGGLTLDNATFNCSDIGNSNLSTLTITDMNGNESSCTAVITVVDLAAPEALCQDITVGLNTSGIAVVTAGDATIMQSVWCEDFNSLPNGTTVDNGTTAWSANYTGAGTFSVHNDQFEATNLAPGFGTWTSGLINISGYNFVNASVDVSGAGSLDNGSDFLLVKYKLDGGPAVLFTNGHQTGTVSGTLATATGLAGNTLQIIVEVVNNDPDEYYFFDNICLQGEVLVQGIDAGSTDNCAVATTSLNQTEFNCSNLGANPVTLTVTDINSNSNTCISSVTVLDTQVPAIACPANVVVDADANLCYANSVNLGTPVAADNCTITLDNNAPAQFNVGITTVTWTVSDAAGNTKTCNQTVEVLDNQAPQIYCPEVVTTSAQAGYCYAEVLFEAIATDNCSATLSYSPSPGSDIPVGITTVTAIATDAAGNSASCTFIATVVDNEPPTITCQNISVQLDPFGMANVTAAQLYSAATDNCAVASIAISQGQTAFDCDDHNMTFDLTLVVTDIDGMTSTCTAQITVLDDLFPCNRPPAVYCQNVTVSANAVCEAAVTPDQVDAGTSDPDGDPLTFSLSPAGPYPLGTTNVIFTATDPEGAGNTCNATITVEDDTPPTISCPQNISLGTSAGQCGTLVYYPPVTKSDNCDMPEIVYTQISGTFFPLGTTTVIAMAIDGAGNTASCYFDITVEDLEAPFISCPANLTVNTSNGQCDGTATFIASATDNCALAALEYSHPSGAVYPVGSTTVIATASDVSGNESSCEFTITVEDHEIPTAICQEKTVQLNAEGNAQILATNVNNGSFDACGIASLSLSQSEFDCSDVGNNLVVLVVTDVHGNTATCDAVVTIEDNTSPNTLCHDITIQLDAAGEVMVTPQLIDSGTSDACGIGNLILSLEVLDCDNVGSNSITLTATDVNGNTSTCTATVMVEDNVPPSVTCKDAIVSLDEYGAGAITATQVHNSSFDACGVASMIVSPNTFICPDAGLNTVTLTVTDINNNTASCTAMVTVLDQAPASALCKNSTINLDQDGQAGIVPSDVNDGSADACGIVSMTVVPNSFDCANVGANSVTLTITDVNGNTSGCNAVVTVLDEIIPEAFCQQDVTIQLDASGNSVLTPDDVDNGSSDACGVSLNLSQTAFDCSNVGDNSVILTVTDNNNNANTCTAIISVQDLVAPLALCQNVTANLDILGNTVVTAESVNANSSDACGIATLNLSHTEFDCSNVGANTVNLTVTDENGNSGTCSATVTVNDAVVPNAICKDISIALDASGGANIIASPIDNGSSDACGIASLSLSQFAFDCDMLGNNVVVLTVTDVNANTSTCSASVSVSDITSPILTAELEYIWPANGVVECEKGKFKVNYSANDPCDSEVETFAVIRIPEMVNPTIIYKTKSLKKIQFKFNQNRIQIDAPQPQDWWEQIVAEGGIRVQDGQIIEFEKKNYNGTLNYDFAWSGKLASVQNTDLVLVCSASDISSNATTDIDYAEFPCDETGVEIDDCYGPNAGIDLNDPSLPDSDCDGIPDVCDLCPGGDDSIDNNDDGFPDCAFPPSFTNIIEAWKCGDKKVHVCHTNGVDVDTICINYHALSAHIAHGDFLSSCGEAGCGNKVQQRANQGAGKEEKYSMELYPNVATQQVNVVLHGFDGKRSTLTFVDQLGRIVLQQPLGIDQSFISIDLANDRFESGVYMVNVVAEDVALTKRLIISR